MNNTAKTQSLGIAGAMAKAFLDSKLTPLLIVASLGLGAFSLIGLPREEEPQINVPMFDIFVPFPGASAQEVQERVIEVGERELWEIPGVEYLYSTAEAGMGLFIVRFEVGTDPGRAASLVHTKAAAGGGLVPPGAQPPLIQPRSIDDVPILALTLSGAGHSELELRRIAAELRREIAAVDDVSEIEILGGRRRTFLVHFDPDKLARHRLTPLEVAGALQASNVRLPAGTLDRPGQAVPVETDAHIRKAADVESVVLGASQGRALSVADVATVSDGPDEDENAVVFSRSGSAGDAPAVTLAVSKRAGANATQVSHAVRGVVAGARGNLLPEGVEVTVTRDYGETAKEKSDELIFHMALATVSVTLLIAFVLGWREAVVVAIAIPMTLALTLSAYYLWGYTLNRITLFALIFSIGILVDDAIVVVENIHRHHRMNDGRSLTRQTIDAVAEVGNPTFLATWTVIAAILPMAFVRGLMGPYMRPIPLGASAAMVFSVLIAFIVSPWAFKLILERWSPKGEHCAEPEEGALDRAYRRSMGKLLDSGSARGWYFAGIAALLLGAGGMLALRLVTVKMLPFDNKSEFEVVLTLPEGSSLGKTRELSAAMTAELLKFPEVESVVQYLGINAPYNFNGLVRHYFLRRRAHQADLAVVLKDRHDRERSSHELAKAARAVLSPLAEAYEARLQVAEVPPGPPVLSTLVFELFGPDDKKREAFARALIAFLKAQDGVVDVDTYIPAAQPKLRLEVDRAKATLNGLPAAHIAQTVATAVHGADLGLAHVEGEPEPVGIRLRLAPEDRRGLDAVRAVKLLSRNGTPLSLGSLVKVKEETADAPVYRKNLRKVSYVIAEVQGKAESPVYAIMDLRPGVLALAEEHGLDLQEYFTTQPASSREYALKWDGEWHITYEVFRDMGIAFAAVLLLIYVLIVAWFGSFSIPLVIMAPIPLTLVGILPAHWAMGAYFTATSMIGFIAGAGIVVRNSIILVDFIEQKTREGMKLRGAVVEAGAVRFRPMLLTAAAVVVGAGVILFDPIFQGLAISLIAGEVASTFLSRTSVPVLYYMLKKREENV